MSACLNLRASTRNQESNLVDPSTLPTFCLKKRIQIYLTKTIITQEK